MDLLTQLDRHLSERIRSQIEERYLTPINAKARLEQAIHDPLFYQDPERYPPFFADHGVVHHRDVACQILQVLDTTHGLLIPAREPNRLEFMKGYGVILAYLHDIGMSDFSHFGRATHADSATQTVFESEFDDILHAIWKENAGNLAWRLTRLTEQGALEQPATLILREMLSMTNCHSKSRMPIETLNDAQKLREAMQERVEADLRILYHSQQVKEASQALLRAQRELNQVASDRLSQSLRQAEEALRVVQSANPRRDAPPGRLCRHYDDFRRDSFRWLVSTHEKARALVDDVIDTLRALRCADALRQRGTVLKTSGGYEVFVDRETANAIYALRMAEGQMFLLKVSNPLAAGEANLASSQLDPSGNLRVSFHRGAFPNPETTRRAAHNIALIIDDIQGDTIESFQRPTALDIPKAAQDMEILLEGVDDNLEFADLVWRELERMNPGAAARTRCVSSMQYASDVELARYLQAEALDWDLDTRCQALRRIARSGHRAGDVNPVDGFRDVRLARLKNDEVLIEGGMPSGFVYIPLGEGLRVIPLGGYATAVVRPWMPLGTTGVIRGATRNSTVTAEQDVALLMIPKEVYLQAWHRTYGVDELMQVLAQRKAALEEEVATLTSLEKRLILQTVVLFAEIPGRALLKLVSIVTEIRKRAGETIFEKGDAGDNMYVIVEGQVRVHDGGHTLNHLDKGDVFGEMALLGPETRMASVTAVVDTHFLRLHREPFQSLMAGHPEMAQGIIRVLLRHLRDRVRDVAELRAHVQQLTG
jgi:CRP-like cAMP-binding protein